MIASTGPSSIGTLVSVQVGPVAALGPEGVPSGFVKRPVAGPVEVLLLGLAGDAQADLTVHGGAEKAVYGYSAAAYDVWLRDAPQHDLLLKPGSFGENLTFAGMDETTVAIGDVHRIGSAVMQVCQPRQPCFKLALRFGDERLPQAMLKNGLCGWYYRVLETGTVAAGSTVALLEQPTPLWTVARLFHLITRRSGTAEEMAELADHDGLAAQWREIAKASQRRSPHN